MSRRRLLVVGSLVLAVFVGALVAVFIVRRDQATPPPPLDIPRAEQQARGACTSIAAFEQQVKDNARGDAVLRTLGDAQGSASEAATYDPRWRSLSSGVDALRLAIKQNDGAAARIGIDVVRAQCQELS